MVDKVWVGKKVQILSLEEVDKVSLSYLLNYGNALSFFKLEMCNKVCEVIEVEGDYFRLKEYSKFRWHLWMVKEPVTIEDILNSV